SAQRAAGAGNQAARRHRSWSAVPAHRRLAPYQGQRDMGAGMTVSGLMRRADIVVVACLSFAVAHAQSGDGPPPAGDARPDDLDGLLWTPPPSTAPADTPGNEDASAAARTPTQTDTA